MMMCDDDNNYTDDGMMMMVRPDRLLYTHTPELEGNNAMENGTHTNIDITLEEICNHVTSRPLRTTR